MKTIDVRKYDGRWLGERNREFYREIHERANHINAKTIIAHPKIVAMLEMLPEFKFAVREPIEYGITIVGELSNHFKVYAKDSPEIIISLIGDKCEEQIEVIM